MHAMFRYGLLAALTLGAIGSWPPASEAQTEHVGYGGLTGSVSEEEFKALHSLTTEKAPAAKGEMIDLAGGHAYLSLPPQAKAPLPGIIVIHEWWGLNDHIKHWTDRLAAEGYAALAVDLYGGKVAATADSAMAYMRAVDDKQALDIMLGALYFLTTDPRVQAERMASIGWCFGGGMSLQLALHASQLDAAVIYYGRLVTEADQVKLIKADVLGIFGNRDESIPAATVNDFDAALTLAGVSHQILRYDADHAFANPSSGNYDQKNAGAAWKEVQAFLAAQLKEP